MLLLIEDISDYRGYKVDTFYLASNIADHYLMQIYRTNKQVPNLILLSITSLFIAAKMEQPQCPILSNLQTVMCRRHKIMLERHALLDLETNILIELDFEIRFVPSLRFLERY